MEAWGRARDIAGKVSDLRPDPNPEFQPENPPAENHLKFIEKISTKIMANQKFGIEIPTCDNAIIE
jgi:hypothetical protein